MKSEVNLIDQLKKVYKYAHGEFMDRRNTAILYTVLLIISIVVGTPFVIFFDDSPFKIFRDPVLLFLTACFFVPWVFVFTAKIRLQLVKDILEQAGYVIARKSGECDIKILEGSLEQISNFLYVNPDLIKDLKSTKLIQEEISSVSYLISPLVV